MVMSINTNPMSLNAQHSLSNTQAAMSTAVARLSSGLRINSSADDAAGLAIADRMNSQLRGQTVAIRNANDAISLSQTADGALGQLTTMAQRMRELAVQSANATNTAGDRANLDTEYKQLQSEVNRTISGTQFNGKAILATTGTQTYQVGAGTTANDKIDVAGSDLSNDATVTAVTGAGAVTLSGGGDDTADVANANTVINNLDTMLTTIDTARATCGATENRFNAVIGNLQTSVTNESDARGRIMDADFATETANLTKAQVLQQAGQAMLSQANSSTSGVLALLKNL